MRKKTEKLLEIRDLVKTNGECLDNISHIDNSLHMPTDPEECKAYLHSICPDELWERPEWYEMSEQEIMYKLEEQKTLMKQAGQIIDPISRDEFNSLFTQCGYDPPNVTDEMLEDLSKYGRERTISSREANDLIYKINKLRHHIVCK